MYKEQTNRKRALTKTQIQKRIEKIKNKKFKRVKTRKQNIQKSIKKLLDKLDNYETETLIKFLYAVESDLPIFVTENNSSFSEFNVFYLSYNEENKPIILNLWLPSIMNRSHKNSTYAYCFRSTVIGMDRILDATSILGLFAQAILEYEIQLTNSDLK